ncbi:MAG TPA: glutamate racemase [Polyangia bacterium]
MIGVFDSGFGGLTVLSSLLARLPGYDYLYLGDSARAPYGTRSFETIYEFTRQAVEFLFAEGCPLVVLACNTASARALRNLQQHWLPQHHPDRRILGVVRPSAEALAGLPPGAVPGVTPPAPITGRVAVLATPGTVASDSYRLELEKLAPGLTLVQLACPMFVPLVEAGELDGPGVDVFAARYLAPLHAAPPERLLLGCTHYPLLLPRIAAHAPRNTQILTQGPVVAERLADWLDRHPEMRGRLGARGTRRFATTDDPVWFAAQGARILGQEMTVERVRVTD